MLFILACEHAGVASKALLRGKLIQFGVRRLGVFFLMTVRA